jgi:4-hydroxy-tetrahydrodipicolinate synthase
MIKGNIVAMITPFNVNGTINYQEINKLINKMILNGVDGVLVLGSTGEANLLTEEEANGLLYYVVNLVDKRMKVIAGVSSGATDEAINKAVRYEEIGADALLVSPSYYVKPNEDGLFIHFSLLSSCVKIPIILYNIPSRSGVDISIECLLKLKKIHNIIGVKESNKDIDHILNLANICDDDFYLYCGNDELSYLFLSLNAKGIINVVGNLDSKIIGDLINIYEDNSLSAYKYFKEHYEFLRCLTIDSNPIPIKALLLYINEISGGVRLPLVNLSEKKLNLLAKCYQSIKK